MWTRLKRCHAIEAQCWRPIEEDSRAHNLPQILGWNPLLLQKGAWGGKNRLVTPFQSCHFSAILTSYAS